MVQFGRQDAPKTAQDVPGHSKAHQDGPKTPPRGPKRRPDPPRTSKILPKWSQVGTKIASKIDLNLKTAKRLKNGEKLADTVKPMKFNDF